MADNQSWDAKRDEIWRRIVDAETAIKNLKDHIATVECLAKNKVSANEEEALKAADQAKQAALQISEISKQAHEFSEDLPALQNQVTEASVNAADTKRHADESKDAVLAITGFRAEAEKATAEITTAQEKAKKAVEDAEAKWATTNQQVQNIANLNAQASADAATTRTSRETIEKLQQEISVIKDRFVEMQASWEKGLSDLQNKHNEQLQGLFVKNDEVLSELNKKYLSEFESRTKEIESLLPGATSAGLASAFADRKNEVRKNQFCWTLLLIAASCGLIALGVLSLTSIVNHVGFVATLAGRAVIVTGLIFLEEFARRNFNIASRLFESYAYKEALAKSYLGYKKQMEGILMPDKNNIAKTNGESALMGIFLDKLDNEPGKLVFDQEKQILGLGAMIDKMSPNNSESASGKTLLEVSKGNWLTKVSWQIVVIIAILAAMICVIAICLQKGIVSWIN